MIYGEYLVAFFIAFIISFSATPIARKIAFRFGAVDIPSENRKIHKRPTARLGGIAIFIGFMVTILFYTAGQTLGVPASNVLNLDAKMFGFLIGAIIIVVMGVVDDIRQLSPKVKLLLQVIAALVVVMSGTMIQFFTNPFEQGSVNIPMYASYIVSVCWIVGITNAINLIDGLDGLAAGISSIALLSLFFVSIITQSYDALWITIILAGATIGFLPYNFNPAKIFMGDTGSNFLGFSLGVISIQGTVKSYTAVAIAIPLLVLGLPLFDTTYAILRRIIKRKSIMEADRGHLHHRLIDMGLSHKQSVVVLYTASATLGLGAVIMASKKVLSAVMIVITVAVFVIGGARYMNEIYDDEFDEELTEAKQDSETETKHCENGEQGNKIV